MAETTMPGDVDTGAQAGSGPVGRDIAERARGAGEAMARVAFRDPGDLLERSRALQLEIARALVKAPSLPVDLPSFDLTLLSIASKSGYIDLVIGKSDPLAALRIRRAVPTTDGDRAARPAAVTVEIVPIHVDIGRFHDRLTAMAQRLRVAITSEKWRIAIEHAKRLAEIPADVPLAFYRQLVPGVHRQGLVRTGFNCNQNCGICWQDRTWGRYGGEQILTWIEDLRAAGARALIISGGEPTLDSGLESYIRHARGLGFTEVTLETNAIQFARPGVAARLRDAGLSDCFVSLHSGDAETSDRITRAPGTFERTVGGIKELLAARVPVRINCVMTREGLDHLEAVPDFVHDTFGDDPSLFGLMLSQPTDPYDRALLSEIVPEPDRLRSVLRRVIDRAFDLGLKVSGLSGPCGPPLCAFGADRRITNLAPVPEQLDGRAYLPACDGCGVRHACFGVRIADVELYGAACVSPIAAP